MLCQFSFSNFRSYRDEATFDFQAASLSEFRDSLIKTDKGNDILPVGVIYGPNGGGKSNLLAALGCVISLVTGPVYELGKNHSRFIIQQKIPCIPYLFDEDSRTEPSLFQLFFRIGEFEYRYFLVLLHNEIKTETLFRRKLGASRSARIFERNNGEISLGSILGSKNIISALGLPIPADGVGLHMNQPQPLFQRHILDPLLTFRDAWGDQHVSTVGCRNQSLLFFLPEFCVFGRYAFCATMEEHLVFLGLTTY